MIDLTKINITDLKKEIFELCQYIYPNDLMVENEGELNTHIFHAIKIQKQLDRYSVTDVARKSVEISNTFLLYKIKEELELVASSIEKEAIEELEVEAFVENVFTTEPDPIVLEEVEKEIRIANIFAEEEN